MLLKWQIPCMDEDIFEWARTTSTADSTAAGRNSGSDEHEIEPLRRVLRIFEALIIPKFSLSSL